MSLRVVEAIAVKDLRMEVRNRSAVSTVLVASCDLQRNTNSPACASPFAAKRPAAQAPRP